MQWPTLIDSRGGSAQFSIFSSQPRAASEKMLGTVTVSSNVSISTEERTFCNPAVLCVLCNANQPTNPKRCLEANVVVPACHITVVSYHRTSIKA